MEMTNGSGSILFGERWNVILHSKITMAGDTLLHSHCTGTYTEVTVLLLWGNAAVTMEYPHSYSVGIPAWVLQGSIGATLKKQHCYFSVVANAVCV